MGQRKQNHVNSGQRVNRASDKFEQSKDVRVYCRSASAVFRKTRERWGGLSNMAAGYPLYLCDVRIPTSEHLYQMCRFPHIPEVQQKILDEKSPMTAKMKSKPYRNLTRSGWERIRIPIMRWALRVKLAQNFEKFGSLLIDTYGLDIVEEGKKDPFWSAYPVDQDKLEGNNALGRLLMQLRDELLESPDDLKQVKPLSLPKFTILEKPIESIHSDVEEYLNVIHKLETLSILSEEARTKTQYSFF